MLTIAPSSTDHSIVVHMADASDGADKTDLEAADLTASYRRDNGASVAVSLSDLSSATDAHSDGGVIHVAGGNYRVDLPDAAWASGASVVRVYVSATDTVQTRGAEQIALDASVATAVTAAQSASSAAGFAASEATAAWVAASAAKTAAESADGKLPSDTSTKLARLDADISSRSTYAGADTSGTTTLLSRLTGDRAGYLDKLDVSGDLAHSDAADTYKATGFAVAGDAMTLTSGERGTLAGTIEGTLIDDNAGEAFKAALVAKLIEDLPDLDDLTVAAIASATRDLILAGDKTPIETDEGAVANVTLVDTTTTNSDMRGTDGANTVAPDNAGIAAIQNKTDDLIFVDNGEGNMMLAANVAWVAGTQVDGVDDFKATGFSTLDAEDVTGAVEAAVPPEAFYEFMPEATVDLEGVEIEVDVVGALVTAGIAEEVEAGVYRFTKGALVEGAGGAVVFTGAQLQAIRNSFAIDEPLIVDKGVTHTYVVTRSGYTGDEPDATGWIKLQPLSSYDKPGSATNSVEIEAAIAYTADGDGTATLTWTFTPTAEQLETLGNGGRAPGMQGDREVMLAVYAEGTVSGTRQRLGRGNGVLVRDIEVEA